MRVTAAFRVFLAHSREHIFLFHRICVGRVWSGMIRRLLTHDDDG